VNREAGSFLRIASSCADRERFVQLFRRFCGSNFIFIPTRSPRPQSRSVRFALTIAGGEIVLGGAGRVVECFSDRQNRYQRPGILIEFTEIDEDTLGMFAELGAVGSAESARPAPETVVMLPHNPFADVALQSLIGFLDCVLFEDMGANFRPEKEDLRGNALESVDEQPSSVAGNDNPANLDDDWTLEKHVSAPVGGPPQKPEPPANEAVEEPLLCRFRTTRDTELSPPPPMDLPPEDSGSSRK
jgi:hypothetical protein